MLNLSYTMHYMRGFFPCFLVWCSVVWYSVMCVVLFCFGVVVAVVWCSNLQWGVSLFTF